MKNTRILFVVLALVLVVSLVACGGERTPDVTDAPATTTEAPVVTTEAPVVTTEAPAVTTEAPAVTTEAPAVTTEAPKEPVSVDYDTLYAGYNADTKSFDDAYLIVNFETGAPNYLYALSGVTVLPSAGSVYKTDDNGNKYVEVASYLDISNLFNVHMYPGAENGNEKYSVEIVMMDLREVGTSVRDITLRTGGIFTFRQRSNMMDFYAGGVSDKNRFYKGDKMDNGAFIKNLNTLSFVADSKDNGDGISIDAYYNAEHATANTNLTDVAPAFDLEVTTAPRYRLVVSSPFNLYAVRIYSRMLTPDEVAQNHFVDTAKYLGLDLTDFIYADEETKLGVYNAFAGYDILTYGGTFEQAKEEFQTLLEIMVS